MNPKKSIDEALHELKQMNMYLKSIAISLQKISGERPVETKDQNTAMPGA